MAWKNVFWDTAKSDWILLVKLEVNLFNIAIIVIYAPTVQCTEEEIDNFYDALDNLKALCKSQK